MGNIEDTGIGFDRDGKKIEFRKFQSKNKSSEHIISEWQKIYEDFKNNKSLNGVHHKDFTTETNLINHKISSFVKDSQEELIQPNKYTENSLNISPNTNNSGINPTNSTSNLSSKEKNRNLISQHTEALLANITTKYLNELSNNEKTNSKKREIPVSGSDTDDMCILETQSPLADEELDLYGNLSWNRSDGVTQETQKEWNNSENDNTPPASQSSLPGPPKSILGIKSILFKENNNTETTSPLRNVNTPEIVSRLLSKSAGENNQEILKENTTPIFSKSLNSKSGEIFSDLKSPYSSKSVWQNEDDKRTSLLFSNEGSSYSFIGGNSTTNGDFMNDENSDASHIFSTGIGSEDPVASTPNYFLMSPHAKAEMSSRRHRESLLMESPLVKQLIHSNIDLKKLNSGMEHKKVSYLNHPYSESSINEHKKPKLSKIFSDIDPEHANLGNNFSKLNSFKIHDQNRTDTEKIEIARKKLFVEFDTKSENSKRSRDDDFKNKSDIQTIIKIQKKVNDEDVFSNSFGHSNNSNNPNNLRTNTNSKNIDSYTNFTRNVESRQEESFNSIVDQSTQKGGFTKIDNIQRNIIHTNDSDNFESSLLIDTQLVTDIHNITQKIDHVSPISVTNTPSWNEANTNDKNNTSHSKNFQDIKGTISTNRDNFLKSSDTVSKDTEHGNKKLIQLDQFLNNNGLLDINAVNEEIQRRFKEEDDMFESMLSKAKKGQVKEFKTPFKKPSLKKQESPNKNNFHIKTVDNIELENNSIAGKELLTTGNSKFNSLTESGLDQDDLFEQILKRAKDIPKKDFKTPFKGSNTNKTPKEVSILKPYFTTEAPASSTLNTNFSLNAQQNSSIKVPNNEHAKKTATIDLGEELGEMSEFDVKSILSKFGELGKAPQPKEPGFDIIKENNTGDTEKSKYNQSSISKLIPQKPDLINNNDITETPTKRSSNNQPAKMTHVNINPGFKSPNQVLVSDHHAAEGSENNQKRLTISVSKTDQFDITNKELGKDKDVSKKVLDRETKCEINGYHKKTGVDNSEYNKVYNLDFETPTKFIRNTPLNSTKSNKPVNLYGASTTTPTMDLLKGSSNRMVHSQGLRRPNIARGQSPGLFQSPLLSQKSKKTLFKPPTISKPILSSSSTQRSNTEELNHNKKNDEITKLIPEISTVSNNTKENEIKASSASSEVKKVSLKSFGKIYSINENIFLDKIPKEVININFLNAKDFAFTNSPNGDGDSWGHKEAGLELRKNGYDFKKTGLSNHDSEKWIQTHYQQLVWYLASMARRFPENSQFFWSKKAVFERLVKIYKKELLESHRPAIRRILERDSSSKLLMVLCISEVISKNYILLSDGWYSIKAQIDNLLSRAVARKRLDIGTKIAIIGSQLKMGSGGFEGISPLQIEDPKSETAPYLLINSNSVRTAPWYQKLGFQPKNSKMSYSLHTLDPSGGSAFGEIDIIVSRRYPLRYMETTTSNTRITRCESEESRCQAEYDKMCRKKAQSLYSNLENESITNRSALSTPDKLRSSINFDEKTGEELYSLFSNSTDPSHLTSMLSTENQRKLEAYAESMKNERAEIVNSELLDLMPPRKVVSFFQVLITDTQQNKSVKSKPKYNRVVLSIWGSDHSVWSQFSEGKRFKLYGVTPSGYKSEQTNNNSKLLNTNQRNFLRLNVTRNTVWVPVKDNNFENLEGCDPRKNLTISQLTQQNLRTDVDIVAIVESCVNAKNYGQDVTAISLLPIELNDWGKYNIISNKPQTKSNPFEKESNIEDIQKSPESEFGDELDHLANLYNLGGTQGTNSSTNTIFKEEKMIVTKNRSSAKMNTQEPKMFAYFSKQVFGTILLKPKEVIRIKDIYLGNWDQTRNVYFGTSRDYTEYHTIKDHDNINK
ncbi:hypothetical protein BB558_001955 [Smittium angustum]|uniref:BRCA2 OB1 domain-containing protein n=1 Tax=Smittium angustum TaxID=133377 RepID=A0A2U1JAE9_SMIAN|nr:hypothetical protein BB558_001955 [Smittium angustum]